MKIANNLNEYENKEVEITSTKSEVLWLNKKIYIGRNLKDVKIAICSN